MTACLDYSFVRVSILVITAVVLVPLIGCGNAEDGNCGAVGSHSSLQLDGSCACDDGFDWANPASTTDFSCMPKNGALGQTATCDTGYHLVDGYCVPDCVRACGNRACGDDGCGGSCGGCAAGTSCNALGQCMPGTCQPSCGTRICGADPVCGQSCGNCSQGSCNTSGECVVDTPPPGGSPVGGACSVASDCAAATASCLSEADGFPSGYCNLEDCIDNGCDEGSTCFYTNSEQTTSACFADCTSASDCRAGYECDSYNTCWPAAPAGGDGNVGEACTSATECSGIANQCLTEAEGLPGGYCTLDCSQTNCPTGSSCFTVGEDSLCLQTCEAETCRSGYSCYDPGACWSGGSGGGCTPEDCSDGTFCASNGECVAEATDLPSGAVPTCTGLPAWECAGNEASCGQLTTFDPRLGDGYWDYPLNGETSSNQYRSYARQDLMLLIKYAAAQTRCLTEAWTYGNGGPLGLGDMSESNGAIPGTAINQPGHPQGTHVDGHDMDIAYFQKGTSDNTLRPICNHVSGGADQYHCVGEPDLLDEWRTAVFIAKLHDTQQLRVIGVDGKAGLIIEEKVAQLCNAGWLDGDACYGLSLAYEVTDGGAGWYRFHHHHMHVSLYDRPSVGWPSIMPGSASGLRCLTADCSTSGLERQLRLDLNRSPILPFGERRRVIR